MRKLFVFDLAAATGVAIVLMIKPAHAYVDPGTGSYFYQLVIGGLVGGFVAVRMFWTTIKKFVTGKTGAEAQHATPRRSNKTH